MYPFSLDEKNGGIRKRISVDVANTRCRRNGCCQVPSYQHHYGNIYIKNCLLLKLYRKLYSKQFSFSLPSCKSSFIHTYIYIYACIFILLIKDCMVSKKLSKRLREFLTRSVKAMKSLCAVPNKHINSFIHSKLINLFSCFNWNKCKLLANIKIS